MSCALLCAQAASCAPHRSSGQLALFSWAPAGGEIKEMCLGLSEVGACVPRERQRSSEGVGMDPRSTVPLGTPPLSHGMGFLMAHLAHTGGCIFGAAVSSPCPCRGDTAHNLPITLLSIPRPTLHRFPSGEHHGQHLPGCAVHLPGRGVPREPHLPVVLGGGERLLQEVSLGRRLPLIPCRGCPRSLLLLLRRSPPSPLLPWSLAAT